MCPPPPPPSHLGRELPADHGDLEPTSGLPAGGGGYLGPGGRGDRPRPQGSLRLAVHTSPGSSGKQANPDSWAPASPEASPHPAAKTSQPSGLRGPPFEDVLAARSSDWLRQLSRADAAPVPQPDTQPSWDSEPRFWQGVLTEQLWQIFVGTHKKDQPRRRSESPWGWGMGVAWGWGRSNGESCCSTCSPSDVPATGQSPGPVSNCGTWRGGLLAGG